MDTFQEDSICVYDFKKLKTKKTKTKTNKKIYVYTYSSKGNYFYNEHQPYSDHPPPPTNKSAPLLRGLGIP